MADAVGQLSQNFLGIALALVLAFMSGWKLALVVLATMPLLVFVVYIQTSMMTSLSSKVRQGLLLQTCSPCIIRHPIWYQETVLVAHVSWAAIAAIYCITLMQPLQLGALMSPCLPSSCHTVQNGPAHISCSGLFDNSATRLQ